MVALHIALFAAIICILVITQPSIEVLPWWMALILLVRIVALTALSVNPVVIEGAAPGDILVCAGDTLRIGTEVRIVTSAPAASHSGRVPVGVDRPFESAVSGAAVEIGARYEIEMELTNRDAGRNRSDRELRPRYRLDFVEVA